MPIAIPTAADFYRVMPELLWCGFGVLLMLFQPLTKNRAFLTATAFVGAVLGAAGSLPSVHHFGPGFFGLIQSDVFSIFFHLLVGSVAALVILAADSYLRKAQLEAAEFFAL